MFAATRGGPLNISGNKETKMVWEKNPTLGPQLRAIEQEVRGAIFGRRLDKESIYHSIDQIKELLKLRPEAEYHEDMGSVIWWKFPIVEPPYVGSPLDEDWPNYHTHFTRIILPEDWKKRDNV